MLRDAARRWPTTSTRTTPLAWSSSAAGACDDALDAFNKAASAAPGDPTAHFNLGRTYQLRYLRMLKTVGQTQAARSVAERDRQRAVEAYKKCVAIDGPLAEKAGQAISDLSWR